MSRKKKKKQKKLLEKTQDQESLNGWNCPATEIDDDDDDDDDDDVEDTDDLGNQSNRADSSLLQPEPQLWEQPTFALLTQPEPVTQPEPAHEPEPVAQPEPAHELGPVAEPEPTHELGPVAESEPTHEQEPAYRPRFIRELEPMDEPEPIYRPRFIREPDPVEEPETVRRPRFIREPSPVEEPKPIHQPGFMREPEAAPPPFTESVPEPTESVGEPLEGADAPVEQDVEPTVPDSKVSLADEIKERVADRLAKSKDGLFKLFTQPHKPLAELEEDNLKFGGLDDDPTQEELSVDEQQPGRPSQLLQKLQALRAQRAEAAARRAELATREEKQPPTSPVLRYGYETYRWGYTECYYIGVQVLRNGSDLRRRLFATWSWARYVIPHFIRKKRQQMARILDAITDSCLHPFRDISAKTRGMRIGITRIFNLQPEHRLVDSSKIFFRYLYSLGKPINSIASFILPILGCAVLATVVLYFQQINYALAVEYSGVQLGYIAKEGDFYEAKSQVYARLINEEYAPPDDSHPTFRLVITDPDNLISTEALANKIMTISKNEVAMADGIYIDGAFLGAVEDGSEFLFYIDSILDNYRTGTAHERVQFVKKVGLQRGMYPISSIRPVHEIKNALESNESLPQTHKVGKEETLEAIAEANNTTVEDVIALNSSLQMRAEESGLVVPSLFEGESILVNRVELSLGIQVTRREVYEEEIDYGTDYTDNNKEMDGYTSTISLGIKGEREIVADVTYVDGEKVNETVIERIVTKEPVNARVMRGTLKPADFLPAGGGDTTASFIWPVAGGYVSAGLYGYRGHSGMDIAATAGTGIYAARSGTVTYASNRNVWPYGKRVNINHGDGVTSLYAHCSEVLVQPGQYVEQGQLIAKVGRTGNATGNHLHIEIKINGRIMNPADFIGKG